MALGKRTSDRHGRRADSFEDDDDALDAMSPKRARTNGHNPLSNATPSQELRQSSRRDRGSQAAIPAEEDDGVVTPDEDEAGAGEEEEEEEQEDDDEMEEDEEDEIDSDDDRIEAQRRLADADQGTAQAGIVEKIELRNFMCHANFKMGLSPELNFVMGRNGSGKSTILTALMIALGG